MTINKTAAPSSKDTSGKVKLDGQAGVARGLPGMGEGLGLDAAMQGLQVGGGGSGDGENYFGVAAVADERPLAASTP